MKRFIVFLVVAIMGFAFTACGSNNTSEGEQASNTETTTEAPAADDNPARNFIGDYYCDRASIHVEAKGESDAAVTVHWGSSDKENTEWIMSGSFDPDKLVFEYHDCVKTDYVYTENGEVKSSEKVYTGGHGFMFFKDEETKSVTWQDDQEQVADDMTFTYTPAME